jgi:hypothetical protein
MKDDARKKFTAASKSSPNFFIEPLPILVRCKTKATVELCAPLEIMILIAITVRGFAESLKGSISLKIPLGRYLWRFFNLFPMGNLFKFMHKKPWSGSVSGIRIRSGFSKAWIQIRILVQKMPESGSLVSQSGSEALLKTRRKTEAEV